MNVETFKPDWSNDNEKLIVLAIVLGAFFTGFIAPLLCFLLAKDKMTEQMLNFTKTYFNWTIFLLICFVIGFIPIIGTLIAFIAGIAFLVVTIINIIAIVQEGELKVPAIIKILK